MTLEANPSQPNKFVTGLAWTAMKAKKIRENIDKASRSNSTPRLALEIMYDLPPLHLVVIQEAISAMARNRTVIIKDWPVYNKKHRTLIGHILYWE